MGLAVLIVSVIVLAELDVWVVQRWRAGDRVVAPTPPTTSPPSMTAGEVEQALTTRLLAGQLDPGRYRDCLAAVAATVDRLLPADETRVVTDLTDESYGLVARLAGVLPRVPEATLCAAVNLTRFGAGVDDLTRLLGLSKPDALCIVTSTSGGSLAGRNEYE